MTTQTVPLAKFSINPSYGAISAESQALSPCEALTNAHVALGQARLELRTFENHKNRRMSLISLASVGVFAAVVALGFLNLISGNAMLGLLGGAAVLSYITHTQYEKYHRQHFGDALVAAEEQLANAKQQLQDV